MPKDSLSWLDKRLEKLRSMSTEERNKAKEDFYNSDEMEITEEAARYAGLPEGRKLSLEDVIIGKDKRVLSGENERIRLNRLLQEHGISSPEDSKYRGETNANSAVRQLLTGRQHVWKKFPMSDEEIELLQRTIQERKKLREKTGHFSSDWGSDDNWMMDKEHLN